MYRSVAGASSPMQQLRLQADSGSRAQRANLITHVRATLAYLETKRENIVAEQRWWWPFRRRAALPAKAPVAEVTKEKPADR
jgi:hypothetical protein